MSIRTRQLEVESEKLLRKELLEGNYPSLTTIGQKVAERFQVRPAGLPRLKPQQVAVRQVSNAEAYNEMVEAVHEDLEVSYKELTFQGDRMMALANYYDTEKARIQLQLKRLNQRTEILQEKLNNSGQRTVFFDTFNDYLGIELDGDKARNIGKTDAFVDLRYGYATLDRFGKGTAKVDMTSVYPRVTPVTTFTEATQLSAVEGALSDLINEGWRYKAVLSEAGEAVITLNLEFTEAVTTNMVSMLPQSPRATFVTLRTSLDGITYVDELEKSVNALTEWNFSERQVRFMEFKLRKAEPDIVNGTSYEFYFGAENISVRSVAFLKEGHVISQPHRIKRSFDNVTLQADEVIPPDTEIKYFLGLDNMDGSIVEWQPIENGKTVNMNAFITEQTTVTAASPGYGWLYGSRYGQDYYRIATLQHAPIPRSAQLFVGTNMFKLDSFIQKQETAYEPTIDTWKRARGFDTKYVSLSDLANANFLDTAAEQNIRLTTYITFPEAKGFSMNAMVLYNAKGAVYLNNSRVQIVGNEYWLNFKAGVNKLEIFYYCDTAGQVDVNVTADELQAIGATSIYAQEKSLQQVSVYDLMNNTSKRDLSKFAVTGANEVILNYNPAVADAKGVGVSYQLSYQYSNGLIDNDNYLRFMATMVRNASNQDLTPVLRSYKLIIE